MTIAALEKGASKGELARQKIKDTARDLFARYGIEKVTIRDIAKQAGQKNAGSVNYYFGSKDDLILEIIDDLAKARDENSTKLLDALEQSGQPITVRALLRILIARDATGNPQEMRMTMALQTSRRDLMHTQIPNRWDHAFRRCITHFKRLIPHHGDHLLQQRLYFLIPYLWTFLATQEGGEEQAQFWRNFWADPSAMESLLDTAEAILATPASADTLGAIARSAGKE